jgi:hypothetical protein
MLVFAQLCLSDWGKQRKIDASVQMYNADNLIIFNIQQGNISKFT